MTNTQLYLSMGIPVLFNAMLFAILMAYINAKIDGLDGKFGERFNGVNQQVSEVREDVREIRNDIKLLTGKVYEMMERK